MKPRRVAIVLVAVILAGWFAFKLSGRHEPRYQDRTLTEWLEYARSVSDKLADPEHPELDPSWQRCQQAIKQMKLEALPILLEDIQATESKFKMGVSSLATNRPVVSVSKRTWLGQLRNYGVSERISAVNRHVRAMYGFALLAPDAKSVEPILIRLTQDGDRDKRLWGFYGFASTRPTMETGLPVMERLLKDPEKDIRDTAAGVIQSLYPEEAEKAGVYEQFPELRPGSTNIIIR